MQWPRTPSRPATVRIVVDKGARRSLPALISEVFARVHAVAPNIRLEWLAVFPDTAAKVADGEIDLMLMPAAGPLPDGLSEHVLAPDRRYTFARRGHPALACWSREAWRKWPHVVVGMYSGARQPVEERMASLGLERQIGARIPDFSGIGPLLANSDMLANQIGLAVLGTSMPTTCRCSKRLPICPTSPSASCGARGWPTTRASAGCGR